MKTRMLDRIASEVEKAYAEKKRLEESPIVFEQVIEETLRASFVSTLGTGSCVLEFTQQELNNWNKTREDIVAFLTEQGFHAEIFKNKYIDVSSEKLRKVTM